MAARSTLPRPTTVDVGIPFNAKEAIANSYLKTAKVTLPEGMGINPSSANGLEACTNAQFDKGTNDPIDLPGRRLRSARSRCRRLAAAELARWHRLCRRTVEKRTRRGDSGEQFRIFIHATSVRYGVNVRLIGNITPNPDTGQLTAVVDENPQATFSNFRAPPQRLARRER